MPDTQLAVVTGGNSGVGLAIARQLLAQPNANIVVVLACRSPKRAAGARAELLAAYPRGDVRLVALDTSSAESVLTAARAIAEIGRVDLLFCNAGAMAIASLSIPGIVRGLLTHPIEFFESSEALVQRRGLLSADGLGLTFQTNTFGHYLLIHALVPSMRSGARVIWTGSSASQLEFSAGDYQHIHGSKPYESSKYIVDQIAVPLDQRLSKHGIRCFVAEPGNVCSGFLAGLQIPVLPLLIALVFYLLRTLGGFGRFTIDAQCASIACIFLAFTDAEHLDPRLKYFSNSSRTGHPYVTYAPLAYHANTADFLVDRLDMLVAKFDTTT
ncbi:hypothetical protein H4S02_005343 [Coemansia sp. RSA 2611]|nr:hypothetical protein H4S01_005718 [Coemansia sp. RSA 2610]KAJ2383348.1 hypothetical protein H4S02_005343 [Coemansia sp. RSA 2611]